MNRIPAFVVSALLAAPSWAGEPPRAAQMLNLSCMEALASVGHERLAGVFSFIPEKDSPAAFADLLVRDDKAMKKYLAKLDKDVKEVSGVSVWDNQVVGFALSIYASPLAEMIGKPSAKTASRLTDLSRAAKMTLEEMTVRRRSKG